MYLEIALYTAAVIVFAIGGWILHQAITGLFEHD